MTRRRPSTSRFLHAQLLRSRILEVAGSAFARRGVEDVSVEHILEDAGVSRRTFYKYFRNKDEVLAALFEVMSRHVIDVLGNPMGRDAPPLGELKSALEAYLDFHANAPPLLKVLAEEAIRPSSALAPMRLRFQQTLMAFTDNALRRAGRDAPDPLVYRGLFGAIEAISLDLLGGATSRAEVERAKRAAWHIVMRVLLAPEE